MAHRPSRSGLQHIPAPTAVIFDWDGTLAFGSFPTLRLAFDMPPHAQGLTSRSVAVVRALPFGIPAERAARGLFGIAPSPESRATLQLLHDNDVPIGIVSNTQHDVLAAEVSHTLGDAMSSRILTRGALPDKRGKPFADSLLEMLDTMGTRPSRHIWFVGDRYDMDVAAAQEAGLSAVLIHPSRHAYDALAMDPAYHTQPIYVVEGHRSLSRLLQQHLDPGTARGLA